jgi:hypothetical protein
MHVFSVAAKGQRILDVGGTKDSAKYRFLRLIHPCWAIQSKLSRNLDEALRQNEAAFASIGCQQDSH